MIQAALAFMMWTLAIGLAVITAEALIAVAKIIWDDMFDGRKWK